MICSVYKNSNKKKTNFFSRQPHHENKRKWKDRQILESCQRAEKLWKITVIPVVVGALGMETGGIGDQRKNPDHPEHSIVNIC